MTTGSSVSSARDVARYYDRNTARFLLVGGGGRVHAMHRELWGPGVTTSREAADHINSLLAEELAEVAGAPNARVLDFGSGVGGTLFRLAERFPGARFHGITVSRHQVEIAQRLAAERGLTACCAFTHGDFHSADLGGPGQAIVAVEAFAHSHSADAFLANAARHLTPGGRLVLADDFLARAEEALAPGQRRRVDQFRAGWRVPAVRTVHMLEREAAEHGLALEKDVDLTPLTRPGARLRDQAVAAMNPVVVLLGLARFPFFGNLTGGHALQVGLREGFLRYRLLVLRKIA